jgi:hypothetical protein
MPSCWFNRAAGYPRSPIGPPSTQGRTLWRWSKDETPIPVEYLVDLAPVPTESDAEADRAAAFGRFLRREGPDVGLPDGHGPEDCLGGEPVFPNHHARGIDNSWRFLCRFRDRGEAADVAPDDPFFLNFGYGSGFVFVSADHREGRFMSDCG